VLILLTSPAALIRKGSAQDPKLVALLKKIRASHPVGLISNRGEPAWFGPTFKDSNVQFIHEPGRQNGQIVSRNAQKFKLNSFDVVVLATKSEDVQMGKNGGAVLIGAGWSTDPVVQALGIGVSGPTQLGEVIELISQWDGKWWFAGDGPLYDVRALIDLSTFGRSMDQATFAQKITETVKGGGARLSALLAATSKSLLMDGVGAKPNLLWGVYPSSNSHTDDSDVLADFTHRLRTTVSKVRYAARDEPLFIRHTASAKRSAGGAGSRLDPTDQVRTLHLNPFYRTSNRVSGRNVVVVDDCTTYGLSFGVAAAFLRKAGAASVMGVALGKFGNQLRHHNIEVNSDPFKPVAKSGFTLHDADYLGGSTSATAQQVLRDLVK
jgi:hypothetical protein